MNPKRSDILSTGNGTTQNNRLLDALRPEFVQIDDWGMSEYLAFLASYSEHIQYFNHKNEATGNWENFFQTDISIILAQVLSTDLDGIERRYLELVNQFTQSHNQQKRGEIIAQIFEHTLDQANKMDRWYQAVHRLNLADSELEGMVEESLYNSIRLKLVKEFHRLKNCWENLKKLHKVENELSFDAFGDVWAAWEGMVLPDDKSNTLDALLIKLRLIYRAFHDNLSYVVFSFQKFFYLSLKEKSNHKPDIGLVITFLRAYKHAQNSLNQLSSRYLDLYYSKILLQTHKESISDKVHVHLELAEHVNTHLLEKGTQLIAGRDIEGDEILFETVNDVEVNHAKIASLKTLFFNQDFRETLTNYEVVTHLYGAPVANSKDGMGTPFDIDQSPWPTFGENQFEKLDDYKNMNYGDVGLAIASPMFFLREGQRQVKITFNFDPDSVKIYEKLVRDVMDKQELSSLEDAFYIIFNPTGKRRNLTLYLSGSRKWVKVDPQRIKVMLPEGEGWTPEQLVMTFTLDVTDPPVVPFNPEVLGEDRYPTDMPVLKILLNHEREPYGYSFVKFLRMSRIDIDVSVDKLKRFQFYNDIGQLDASQPFQPFGPTPAIGSYLLVGASEVFQKPVENISIDLDWQDMPKTDEEFEQYYKDYELEAHHYKIRVSALTRNEFYPKGEEADLEFPLFLLDESKDSDRNDPTVLKTHFNLDSHKVGKFKLQPKPDLPALNEFNNDTQSGYLKIELIAPEEAFGHAAYQKVITKAMSKNAKAVQDSIKKNEEVDTEGLEVPNPPFTPMASAITMKYEASTRMDLVEEDPDYPQHIFHIHPFGTEKVFPNRMRASSKIHLLPQYDADGYLFIGLTDVKPQQTISMFFQLISRSFKEQSALKLPDIKWRYLSRNNEWKAFDQLHFLSDTTDNFTKSGIIRFKLPADISNRGSVLPTGLYWIGVSVSGDTEMLGQTLAVETQAVVAKWVNNGKEKRLRRILPPHSIDRLADRRPEVSAVYQPFESFGGRPKENDEEFFTRVSERLRHKGRAITHWDFERLVLEHFHDIFQVKCLSYMTHPEIKLPELEEDSTQNKEYGKDVVNVTSVVGIKKEDGIVLVVVPKRAQYIEDNSPTINYKQLLSIEQYLGNFASPFINIKVRNPVYEYVRVYCKVKFTDNANFGQDINRLKRDIQRFVCPWFFDKTKEVQIGGQLSLDSLKNYLTGLNYVKFITKFSILHVIEEENGDYQIEDTAADKKLISVIYASKPWAVLIPDEDHVIDLLEGDEREELPEKIEPPIAFKTKYNIHKRTQYIKIHQRKKAQEDSTDMEGGDYEYQLNIKI